MSNKGKVYYWIVAFVIGWGAAIGSFFYFKASLWLLINLAVCSLVFVLTVNGIILLSGVMSKGKSKGENALGGAVLLVLLGFILFGLHSCFYTTEEERQERARINQLREAEREEEKQAAIRKDQEETAEFLASGERIKVYGVLEGNDKWRRGVAERAIKLCAHDPKSVSDVVPLSQVVRVRIKDYPRCRYAIRVSFRAKNALGALTRHTGIVLLDNDRLGIAVLENPFFDLK